MSDLGLKVLVYTSNAVNGITDDELEKILLTSVCNNQALMLTGVLLYNDGSFFQYLEGPAARIDRLLQRLHRDPRHANLTILLEDKVPRRVFPSWSMALFRPSASELLKLSNKRWWAEYGPLVRLSADKSGAMALLKGICEMNKPVSVA